MSKHYKAQEMQIYIAYRRNVIIRMALRFQIKSTIKNTLIIFTVLVTVSGSTDIRSSTMFRRKARLMTEKMSALQGDKG